MFAANFDYYRAGSVAEAGELLVKHPGAKILAGGHSLIPLLKLRLATPATVIDIGRLGELRGIASGDSLTIGSLTTHAELARSADVKRHAEALGEAASQVGDPAVRNRGTIGGNIAHADPASDLPIVLAALGATINIIGNNGQRSVSASDFLLGVMMTALHDDEVLTSIEIPAAPNGQGTAYEKFSHPASRYDVIGVAAAVTTNNSTCTSASVAIGGLVPVPLRCPAVEQVLTGETVSEEALTAASEAVNGANGGADDLGDNLLGDLFASADYRKAIASVYVRRALAAAVERAG